MSTNDIAIIGIGTLGKNLACNVKSRKYNIAVYDADFDTAFQFENDSGSYIKAYTDIKSLIQSVAVPRVLELWYEGVEDRSGKVSCYLLG